MRAWALVGVVSLPLVVAGCGGHATTAATTSAPPSTPTATGTSADSCYLVRVDLRSLAAGGDRATLLAQMTADAATGSASLQAAVATYRQSGDSSAITRVCGGP